MLDSLSGNFIQWLRGFYYTAKLGSVSAAAERMGLQQPAVSYLIRSLEHDLGIKLFQRLPRAMQLTAEGCQLLERCPPLFEMLRRIKEEVGRDNRAGYQGEIRIRATHTAALNYLPGPLRSFAERYPQVSFKLSCVAESSRILDAVLNGEADMGIADLGVFSGGTLPVSLQTQPLFFSRLVLIAEKNAARIQDWRFTLTPEGNLKNLSQLAKVPFIRMSSMSYMAQLIDSVLEKEGIRLCTVLSVNTATLLKRYVREGMGVAIIDDFAILDSEDLFDIYPLDVSEKGRTYHLITRLNRYVSAQARAFMEHVRNMSCPGFHEPPE